MPAYIDSSCLVAMAFDEPGARALRRRVARVDRLLSSNLAEAEVRAALVREGVRSSPASLLAPVSWVFPDRPLTVELERVLQAGYVRGADLWHLACALFLAPDPAELAFLTLDSRQRTVAHALGFAGVD